ncbi:MAG: LamG domain-containing protein [Candidatus Omnitrophica bacterium]|nr:LamG domain-containing protein [Candidatus Omnitrophota bacterium]
MKFNFKKLIITSLLLGIFLRIPFGASLAYAQNFTSDMVLWWKFDEGSGTTVADSSGNSNTGTLVNTPTWTTGQISGAVSFNGTTQYVTAADANSLDLTTAATVAFWFKRSANGVQTSFGKWDAGTGQAAYIIQIHTNNIIYWSTSSNGSGNTYFTSSSTYADTDWHHLVGVYDASTLTVYYDGVSIAGSISGAVAASLFNATSAMENRYNGGNYFGGILDEARVYSRALSAADVAALYAYSGGAGSVTVTGTVYIDEGTTNIGANKTVALSINGGGAAGTDDTDAGGGFAVSGTFVAGDVLTLYLDGETEKAVAVTVAGAPTIAMDLYQNRLIARQDNGGSLTNSNLDTANNNGDADITALYSISGGALTVASGKELFIWSGDTFAPGANVTSDSLDINGTFTMGTNNIQVTGTWDATGGSFSGSGAGQVMFTGTVSRPITSAGNAFNNVIINDGLVAYWKLDETAANSCSGGTNDSCDSSGYRNDGAWAGTATADSTIPTVNFKNERSVVFDGSNSYVTIPDNNNLDLVNNFTISMWIKPAVLTQSNRYLLSKINGAGSDNSYAILWEYTNNSVEFYTGEYTGDNPRTGSTMAIGDTNWHHVAYTYNGSNWIGYLDSTPIFSLSKTFALVTSTGNLILGDFNGAGTWAFNGRIDDLRIYKRALTAGEISALGNGNQPGTGRGTFIIQDTLDVNGNLTLHSGSLDTKSGVNNSINLAGDWNNFGGIFIERSSTVTLDGTNQTISASETFYDLIKTESNDNSTDETLTFGKGSTTIITHDWMLDGRDADDRINLISSTSGTAAKVNPQATRTLDYIDVKDSNNINAAVINCKTSECINSGGNTNWSFRGPLKGAIMMVE